MRSEVFFLVLAKNMVVTDQMEDDLSKTVLLILPLLSCFLTSFHFSLSSGSRLGGIVTTMCFFFNHGEVSALPLSSLLLESGDLNISASYFSASHSRYKLMKCVKGQMKKHSDRKAEGG